MIGFIYALANPCMPGVFKIGMTTKHPELRAAELSLGTGCPEPFEVIAFFDHPEAHWAEKQIHAELSEYRVNDRREFFALHPAALQEKLREWIDSSRYMGIYRTTVLDVMVHDAEVAEYEEWAAS